MLKLKFQYFGHLMWSANSLEKTWERLRAREEGGDRGWDGWMAFPTQQTWIRAETGRWWRSGKPGVLQFMGSQSWTQLSNLTTCQSRGAVSTDSFLSWLPLDHLSLSISPYALFLRDLIHPQVVTPDHPASIHGLSCSSDTLFQLPAGFFHQSELSMLLKVEFIIFPLKLVSYF